MKKLAKLGILALFLVALVGSAFAFPGNFSGNEEARDAIEANDYEAWQQAKINGLTEERFDALVQKHQEMTQHREEKEQRMAEIDAAIAEGYDAWVEAIEGHPQAAKLLKVVNEDNFETFVAMHEAKVSGDHETAKELANELGLKGPGKGKGLGQGKFKGKMHIEEWYLLFFILIFKKNDL